MMPIESGRIHSRAAVAAVAANQRRIRRVAAASFVADAVRPCIVRIEIDLLELTANGRQQTVIIGCAIRFFEKTLIEPA